jgi:N-hydroxyarylamine O-acetyltransferase
LDTKAYLSRINFDGPAPPTLETLRGLHYAHLLAVPFENLDIPERPIALDEERFFAKIVRRRRGGFCYELNGLFAALLRELGFRVTLLSARVAKDKGPTALMEFDHLALRVELDEPWLADVGFGEAFIEPMPLRANAERVERGLTYRLALGEDRRWKVLARRGQNGNGFKPLYDFTLTPHPLSDFAGMCRYHQTSPDSPFMQRKVCSRLTPAGRITLANMRLIVSENGARQERNLDAQEYRAALREYFGITHL